VLFNHPQHIAPEKQTATVRYQIPRRAIEKVHAVREGEIETAWTMALLVSFAQVTQGSGSFVEWITGFMFLRHETTDSKPADWFKSMIHPLKAAWVYSAGL
jgi:hypothetical protein